MTTHGFMITRILAVVAKKRRNFWLDLSFLQTAVGKNKVTSQALQLTVVLQYFQIGVIVQLNYYQ